jgi:hypothetical protein
MRLELVRPAPSPCGNPDCTAGGIPCDCTTLKGAPRVYCRLTHDRWTKSHPCPICLPEHQPTK